MTYRSPSMIRRSRRALASVNVRRHGALLATGSVAVWLAMAFADGPIYLTMSKMNLSGHLAFIMPVILGYFSYQCLFNQVRLSRRSIGRQAGIGLLFLLFGILQSVVIGAFDVFAYGQLYAMLALMFLFRDVFAENAHQMGPEFKHTIIIVHFLLCTYVILSWITLNILGFSIDFDIGRTFFQERGASEFLSFKRVSGLHRESSWAGIALSVSLLACFLLHRRLLAWTFPVYLIAILATGSITGFLFAGLFVAYQMLTHRRISFPVKLFILCSPILAGGALFKERLASIFAGTDPSTLMRLNSFEVGWSVIQNSFPMGTGFGNFRELAFYGSQWSSFIDLSQASFYKTDIGWLNLVAELGLFGVLVLAMFLALFRASRSLLLLATMALSLFVVGALIVPYYFVLAALAGLQTAALGNRPQRQGLLRRRPAGRGAAGSMAMAQRPPL